jgi:hypothetical protein
MSNAFSDHLILLIAEKLDINIGEEHKKFCKIIDDCREK